jgi:FKBP-type peptidyl-prolyl cis-trans isomerase
MTQTVNDQNNAAQKRNRPGQRQQERLQRIERRRRRQQIWISTIVSLVLLTLVAVGFFQYQRYTAQQQTAAAAATATATTKVNATATVVANVTATAATAAANVTATAQAHASATALANAVQTATSGSPTPAAGPATPPALPSGLTTVKLPDGLQYIDIKVGTGPVAQQGSTVSVEYTGWLASDSKKFDSSYDHGGQPFQVTPLGQAQVIKGWNEGLVGMKAGGTRRLIIPPSLGYGAQANGPIPANATLIFDVTAITVQ